MAVKKARLKVLQDRIKLQTFRISEAMMGNEERVLVTGVSKKSASELQARTDNNRIVNFKGEPAMIGQMITVKIVEAKPYSLRGEVV